MSGTISGYRAFPQNIIHPKNLENLKVEEFNKIEKSEMQSLSSVCEGHDGTTIWFTKSGYIVQVKTTYKGDFYIVSPCTFTPTMGMDSIDGSFAQDAEEYIFSRELNFKTDRLEVFEGKDFVDTKTYLQKRGFIKEENLNVMKSETVNKSKKWWQFW